MFNTGEMLKLLKAKDPSKQLAEIGKKCDLFQEYWEQILSNDFAQYKGTPLSDEQVNYLHDKWMAGTLVYQMYKAFIKQIDYIQEIENCLHLDLNLGIDDNAMQDKNASPKSGNGSLLDHGHFSNVIPVVLEHAKEKNLSIKEVVHSSHLTSNPSTE